MTSNRRARRMSAVVVEGLIQARQPRRFGRADEHARGVPRVRVFVDRLRSRRPIKRHGLRAERFREPQQVDPAIALAFRQPEQLRRLDIDRRPFGVERIRHALAGAHELLGLLVRPDRD